MMIVVCSPNTTAAFTNCVYVNPSDFSSGYLTILPRNFVYKCVAHPDVVVGTIALNAMARRDNKAFPGDVAEISAFITPANFTAESVTLTAEWLKKSPLTPDLRIMTEIFKLKFEGHVFSQKQGFVMEYEESSVLLRVKTPGPMMIGKETTVTLEWS